MKIKDKKKLNTITNGNVEYRVVIDYREKKIVQKKNT